MLNQFIKERNLSKSTVRHYTASVRIYESLNNNSLTELINEAEYEENLKIRWKNRKIKKRLISFRSYLYENKTSSTSDRYLTDIQTIYRHFEIELHTLPTFNSKQINKPSEIKFKDLPTEDNISDACEIADEITELIILLIVTSGLAKAEILNMTVRDFTKAKKSHPPIFYLTRIKTGKEFFTFTTPKISDKISSYIEKHDLKPEDKLFNISASCLGKNMQKINNQLNLGRINNYSRFRCHMLRKYHASNLLNNTSFTIDEIDTLQGRSKSKVHRSYFLNDEERLKEKYLLYLNVIDLPLSE